MPGRRGTRNCFLLNKSFLTHSAAVSFHSSVVLGVRLVSSSGAKPATSLRSSCVAGGVILCVSFLMVHVHGANCEFIRNFSPCHPLHLLAVPLREVQWAISDVCLFQFPSDATVPRHSQAPRAVILVHFPRENCACIPLVIHSNQSISAAC
jgi:hypothetical protein